MNVQCVFFKYLTFRTLVLVFFFSPDVCVCVYYHHIMLFLRQKKPFCLLCFLFPCLLLFRVPVGCFPFFSLLCLLSFLLLFAFSGKRRAEEKQRKKREVEGK